jgi:hypothetical protein
VSGKIETFRNTDVTLFHERIAMLLCGGEAINELKMSLESKSPDNHRVESS